MMDWSVLIIQAHVADSGEQGLAMLEELQPTFVLTDIKMAGMDGWQTLQAIRRNPTTQSLPVIAITGNVSVREAALENGFDGFIAKPVSIDTIIADIYHAVDEKIRTNRRTA